VEGCGDDALALVGHIAKLVHAQLQVPHVRRDLGAEDRLLFADVCSNRCSMELTQPLNVERL
jgi:hypothetical protein